MSGTETQRKPEAALEMSQELVRRGGNGWFQQERGEDVPCVPTLHVQEHCLTRRREAVVKPPRGKPFACISRKELSLIPPLARLGVRGFSGAFREQSLGEHRTARHRALLIFIEIH